MASKRRRGEAMVLASGAEMPKPKVGCEQPRISSMFPSISHTRKRKAQAEPTREHFVEEQTQQPATLELPEELRLLQRVHEAILSGRSLLKRRCEKITFTTLTQVVESATGRTFKMEYVQQIKHLYPEAFEWHFIRCPTKLDPSKLEFQLILNFDNACQAASGTSQQASGGRLNEAAERAAFVDRCQAWWQQQLACPAPNQQAACASQLPSSRPPLGPEAKPAAMPTLLIPCAPLPSKEAAPLVGASPHGANRRAQAASCPTSGSPCAAVRSASAAPGASIQGACTAAPVGGSLLAGSGPGRSRQGSILDAFQVKRTSSATGPVAAAGGAPSPFPSLQAAASTQQPALNATPTSRLKRRPSASSPHCTSQSAQEAEPCPDAPQASAEGPAARSLASHASDMPGPGISASSQDPCRPPAQRSAPLAAAPVGRSVPRRQLRLGDEDVADRSPLVATLIRAQAHSPTASQDQAQGPFSREVATPQQAQQAEQHAATALDQTLAPATPLPHSQDQLLQSQPTDSPGSPRRAALTPALRPSPSTPAVNRAATASAAPSPSIAATANAGTKQPSPLLARFFSQNSLAAMQQASERAPQSPALKAAAERRHALGLLPQVLELLRAIFGTKGSLVKPVAEVAELMRQKSSLSTGLSLAEARLTLQLMTQHVPEYASFETLGDVAVLRVSRPVDVAALRQRVRQAAAAASATGL
ncbi:hypothetical protein V8C86DRAFT_2579540 [Haematococcus lacustris]